MLMSVLCHNDAFQWVYLSTYYLQVMFSDMIKNMCVSTHLLLYTLLQFLAKGSKQWVMYFSTLLLSKNQNSFIFCASICPCKGGSTLSYEKYSFLTRSKILRSINIVCGVGFTFSYWHSLHMKIWWDDFSVLLTLLLVQ